MVVLTASACLAALFFRTHLRSRYWARQIIAARDPEACAVPLTMLCNAQDAGRWGVETLLMHSEAEIRQYGVLVLQHIRSDWSRGRMIDMLQDSDSSVREMAVLGLAVQGDKAVVLELKLMYAQGDLASSSAACAALERLNTPAAVEALLELAAEEHESERLAALIDALSAVGSVECAAALLDMLDDHRKCDVPTRAERMIERYASVITPLPYVASSRPAQDAPRHTIAERAAAGLTQITGLYPPFGADLPEAARDQARSEWRQWVDQHRNAPTPAVGD